MLMAKIYDLFSKYKDFIQAFLISAFAFCLILIRNYPLDKLDVPHLYQARDIWRAFDLYFRHKAIWYGPELSGGGNLPGPFYYWLIGLPLIIFRSYFSILVFEYLLASLSLGVFWYFLKKNFSLASALLFALLFISSGTIKTFLADFWNPTFLFLFISLIILFLYEFENNLKLSIGALILGLTVQIHYVAILFLLSCALAIMQSSFNTTEKKQKIILLFCFFVFPLLPYLISAKLMSASFSSLTDVTSGVTTFCNHITLMLSNFSLYFNLPNLKKIIQFFFQDKLLILGLFSFFLSRNKKIKNKFLLISLILNSFLIFWLFYGFILTRYLIPFVILLNLYIAINVGVFVSEKINLTKLSKINTFVSVTVFVLFIVFQMNHNKTNTTNTLLHDAPVEGIKIRDANLVLASIIQNTNWPYEYFRDHTYIHGIGRETDFSLFYHITKYGFTHDLSETSKIISTQHYDGLLLVHQPIKIVDIDSNSLILDSLKQLNFDEIYKAFAAGEIKCNKTEIIQNYQLCYYNFANPLQIRRITNVGSAYLHHESIVELVKSKEIIQKTGPGEALISINSCDSLEPDCSIFFKFKILHDKKLYLEITGEPVAAIDPAVNPAWAVALINVRLKINCNGNEEELVIVKRLGWEYYRNSVLAPFEAYYSLKCFMPRSINLIVDSGHSVKNNFSVTKFNPINAKWTISE